MVEDSVDMIESNDGTPLHRIRRINLTTPFTYVYKVIGSANGLVCIYGWQEHITCICNPMTKKYVSLPTRDYDGKYSHCSGGFGYLPLTNEYKVVQLYRTCTKPYFIEAEVYTIGSGTGWRIAWRLDLNFTFPLGTVERGVYANGAIHWKADNNSNRNVLVFDLIEERLREHLPPPPMPPNGIWLDYSIRELGGVLYYAVKLVGGRGRRRHSEIRYDIWLLKQKNENLDMTEQVEHQPLGWSKEFSVPGKKPLAFTKSGGVLCFDEKSLSAMASTSRGSRKRKASTSKNLVDSTFLRLVLPHKNTLMSLIEIGKEV
ncbi:F-box/kelch-repeat protein At3g23880-like [Papaver somniferum]|uniref:F-box/kelch-repeat protein At3g23880-like n=1 Tax=Papaver somniferum TaxID=3469 RepID=UPI000E6FEAF6|nr:F-box/kelch-repeat protein At3g23880-like [Papaver somniferum]